MTPYLSQESLELWHSQKLRDFLKYRMRYFDLDHIYDMEEVLIDTVLEFESNLKKGLTIRNPIAWSKKVGYYVLIKLSEKENSFPCDHEVIEFLSHNYGETAVQEQELEEVNNTLKLALQQLRSENPVGFQLLEFKYLQGLSWSEIASQYCIGEPCTEQEVNRFRQKGNRALKRLREIFAKCLDNDLNELREIFEKCLDNDLNESFKIKVFDQKIDSETLIKLKKSIDDYAAAFGYEEPKILNEYHGSWFKEIRYKFSKIISPKDMDAIVQDGKDLYRRGVENTKSQLEKQSVETTQQMVEATATLIKSVENIDNTVLCLGKLILIKQTLKDGRSKTYVRSISSELQNKLECMPEILDSPETVIRILRNIGELPEAIEVEEYYPPAKKVES